MTAVESELAASRLEISGASAEHARLTDMLESYTVTITNLTLSLETEASKVHALEESLHVQQTQLKQAITSPALLRHTPLKSKSASASASRSSVKERVEEYEHHLFNMNLSPSTRKCQN
jgi:hypothetical protein